jgi:hypothetical protein
MYYAEVRRRARVSARWMARVAIFREGELLVGTTTDPGIQRKHCLFLRIGIRALPLSARPPAVGIGYIDSGVFRGGGKPKRGNERWIDLHHDIPKSERIISSDPVYK